MAIIESMGRIGTTLLAMVQTRMELAAVEIEEESRRTLVHFVLALISLIFFAIALVLVSLTIILVFWDTYRLLATLGLAALYTVIGIVVAMKLKASFATKPRFLAATVGELKKDVNYLRNPEPTE
ncbi:MAG: phage holin family protein [Pseudomonadota bacterium]